MDPRPYTYEYRKPRLSNLTYNSDHLYESIYHMKAFGKILPNSDKVQNTYLTSRANHLFEPNSERRNPAIEEKLRQQISKIDPYAANYKIRPTVQPQSPRMEKDLSMVSRPNIQEINERKGRQSSMQNYPTKPKIEQQFVKVRLNRGSEQKIRKDIYQNSFEEKPMNNFGDHKYRLNPPKNYRSSSEFDNPQKQMFMSNYGSRLLVPTRIDQDMVYQRQQKPYDIISCYPKNVSGSHRVYPKISLQHKLIENGLYPFNKK